MLSIFQKILLLSLFFLLKEYHWPSTQSDFRQWGSGQSIIEYTTLLVVISAAIIIMGPYLLQSWNANLKTFEHTVLTSLSDPLVDADPPPLTCSCNAWQDAICGGSVATTPLGLVNCDVLEMLQTRTCAPLGCEYTISPPFETARCIFDPVGCAYCGDGAVNLPLEQCDPPDPGNGCREDCLFEGCGNGILEPALDEVCDGDDFGALGLPLNGGCSDDCQNPCASGTKFKYWGLQLSGPNEGNHVCFDTCGTSDGIFNSSSVPPELTRGFRVVGKPKCVPDDGTIIYMWDFSWDHFSTSLIVGGLGWTYPSVSINTDVLINPINDTCWFLETGYPHPAFIHCTDLSVCSPLGFTPCPPFLDFPCISVNPRPNGTSFLFPGGPFCPGQEPGPFEVTCPAPCEFDPAACIPIGCIKSWI